MFPTSSPSCMTRTLDIEETDIDQLFNTMLDKLYPPDAADSPYGIEIEDETAERRNLLRLV